MSEIDELNSIFTDIANSIRDKLNVSTSYYPEDMADAIDSISGGGGGSIASHLDLKYDCGSTAESSYTYTFTEAGLHMVSAGVSYGGTVSIQFTGDPTIVSSQTIDVNNDGRKLICQIVDVEVGDTVTLVASPSTWQSFFANVIKISDMSIDNFIAETHVKDSQSQYTLPNDNNYYLVYGVALGKGAGSATIDDRTDIQTSNEASINIEMMSGIYGKYGLNSWYICQGKNAPQFKFYGYDGGFSAILVWKVSLESSASGVTVLSGTSDPSANQGVNGNIYLKYNDAQAYELPSNCTPLTYIETISGAYIDTGVTPTVDTSADLYGLVPLEGSRYGNLLGEGDRSGRIWAIRYTENGNGVQFLLGIDEDAINCNSITIGESYDIHAEKGKLIINGTEYTGTTAVSFSDPISTLKIFSDGGQQAASARISRCKIYEDGVLIRDMVPARYESGPAAAAGTIGMYDMVNDVFHYDTGGRTIVAGPVMVDNQITAAYVKVNGTWQNLFESSLDNVG